jgi:hypothetical protein
MSSTGRYHGATRMFVPGRIREVWAVAVASVTSGSSAMRCSSGSAPSGVPG